MKTAIYLEDGRTQFVLTPETDIDRKVLKAMEDTNNLKTFRGSFYSCAGGWTRWRPSYNDGGSQSDDSLIFVMDRQVET